MLSSDWTAEKVYSSCYTGGRVVWCQSSQKIFALCSEEVHIFNLFDTFGDVRQKESFGIEGDGILTFDVSSDGKTVMTANRSLLLRRWESEKRALDSTDGADGASKIVWKCVKAWRVSGT